MRNAVLLLFLVISVVNVHFVGDNSDVTCPRGRS